LCEIEQENKRLNNDLEQLEFVLDYEKDAMTMNIRKWGA
jgi:hypothetical protein